MSGAPAERLAGTHPSMLELILIWTAVMTVAALVASFAFSDDAESPAGDGMILGCLLLAVPLWPISMPFWLWYVLQRHRDAQRMRR